MKILFIHFRTRPNWTIDQRLISSLEWREADYMKFVKETKVLKRKTKVLILSLRGYALWEHFNNLAYITVFFPKAPIQLTMMARIINFKPANFLLIYSINIYTISIIKFETNMKFEYEQSISRVWKLRPHAKHAWSFWQREHRSFHLITNCLCTK